MKRPKLNTVLLVAIALNSAIVQSLRADELAASELDGIWNVESARDGGKRHPLAGFQVLIDGDNMQFNAPAFSPDDRSQFTIDTEQSPPHIDLQLSAGGETELRKGILRRRGARLTLCLAQPDAQRPTRFSSTAENDQWSLELRHDAKATSDLKKLQGPWEKAVDIQGVKFRVVNEIDGIQETVTWYSAEESPVMQHTAQFMVQSWNRVTLFTFWNLRKTVGPETGKVSFTKPDSFIYRYREADDTLIHAFGVIDRQKRSPENEFWTRVKK